MDEASLAVWADEDSTLPGRDAADPETIEEPLPPLTERELLEAAENGCRALRMFECHRLLLAADWADRHPGVERISAAELRAGKERGLQFGGEGTPVVAEFAPAEFAAAIGTTSGAGQRLVADVLDLRHRMPRLWQRVVDAEVEAWQARKIAQATRPLTPTQAGQVDTHVAGLLGGMPWSRLERIVDGRIIEADPERAARLADQAARARFVGMEQTSQHGTRMVHAKMDAADATWLDAVVDRVADLLASRRGVTALKDERRAMALGLLARPVEALQLLTEEDPAQPDEQNGPDPNHPDPNHSDPNEPDAGQGIFRAGPATPGRLSADQILAAINQVNQAAWRPKIVLHAHIAAEALAAGRGVVRVEQLGPQVLAKAKEWLGRSDVSVRPVIDLPNGTMPSDAYEVPALMREHLVLARPTGMFPWSTGSSRSAQMDHTIPYDHTRSTGGCQTRIGNLAPLSTFAHRMVTHGRWQRRQPQPGTLLFRAPHGRVLLVDHHGTRDLGTGRFALLVWQACGVVPAGVADAGSAKPGAQTAP